tara:strand:- start:5946 stop:7289 length:1344 start_codon:yes stop_codon:yes gene_type:complete
MNTTRELVQIQPTNLGTGKFSFKGGVPQIVFDIPMMPKIMNGKSLRIQGTFSCFTGLAAPNNVPDNQNEAATRRVWIDSRTGVSSCIDFLSIQNQEGATYEMIKNYNRLCASLLPLNDSFNDFIGGGIDIIDGATSKNKQMAKMCDKPFDFALPLRAGFLQGSPIDLQLVKGLRITIQLAADNFVMRNNYYNDTADTSGDSGAYYELSDVMLTFEAQVPDAEGQEAMVKNMNGVWNYNAYTSFYSVVQSSDHNAIMNVNTSRTIGTIMNMTPSKFLNSHKYNSQLATQFRASNGAAPPVLSRQVNMNDLTFTKGGLRIPLDFEVSSEDTQRQQVADSQKNYVELNAIRKIWSLSNELKGLRTELSLPNAAGGAPKFRTSMNDNDAIQVYNIGVSYDHITENGLNFKGNPLGIRIQSDLTAGTPHSLFVFVKHKNTIVFKDGQVSVLN